MEEEAGDALSPRRGLWSTYVDTLRTGQAVFGSAMGRWGGFVHDHTWAVFWTALIVGLALAAGWARIGSVIETKGEKLWTPQDSEPQSHKKYLEDRFGESIAFVNVTVDDKAQPAQGNVLTASHIRDAFASYTAMLSVKLADGQSFENGLCLRTSSGCAKTGILDVWNFDVDLFEARVAEGGAQSILDDINASTLPSGLPNVPDRYLVVTGTDGDRITEASVVTWRAALSADVPDSTAGKWYDGVDRTLKTAQWSAVSGRILWAHGSSLDDEISAVTGSDIHLVVISFVLMAVFAAAALFNKSPVKSKTSLAMSGVGVVMLSILAAYGLCMFFGIMFTPLSQLLPFILVGVGLDDIFVLITGLDEVRAKHPELADLRSQLVETMRTFGVSISVTSSTNLLAFALGAATRIPSVQAFCAYAGLAIIIDFALQISLFLAVLIFNERRTAANKLDWVCCITASVRSDASSMGKEAPVDIEATSHTQPPALATRKVADEEAASSQLPPESSGVEDSMQLRKEKSAVDRKVSNSATAFHAAASRLIQGYLAPLLATPAFRVFVILAFAVMVSLGIVAITEMKEGLPLSILTRSTSDPGKFFRLVEATLDTTTGTLVKMYFRDLDFANPDIQAGILSTWYELQEELVDTVDVDANVIEDVWLHHLIEYAESMGRTTKADGQTVVERDQFYPTLLEWLGSSLGREFGDDFYFDESTGKIEVTRWPFYTDPRSDPEIGKQQLSTIRSFYHGKSADFGGSKDEFVFAYYPGFVFEEGELVLKQEILTNLASATAGVFLMCVITLVHPLAAVLCTVSVFTVMLGLFFLIWALDMRFNSVSAINLVMAVGLSVDYSLHMSLHIVTTPGESRVERMSHALLDMGPAVLLGGLSTLLGLLPLAGTTSDIFQTFFKLMAGTIGFGLAAGLLLVPSVMAFIAPKAIIIEMDNREQL